MGLGRYIILGGVVFFTLYVWVHLTMAWCGSVSDYRALPALAIAALVMGLVWGPPWLGHVLHLPLRIYNRLFELSATFMMMELWFGFAVFFCDAANCGMWLWRHWHPLANAAPGWLLTWRQEAALCGVLTLVAAIIGYCQAGRPNVHTTVVSDPRIPAEASGYRILFCSDLHLINPYREEILECLESAIRQWRPGLFLHAGDFIDGPRSGDLEELCDRLAKWDFPDGKYGSLGNHDGYGDWRVSQKWHQRSGVTILGNLVGNPTARPLPWLHLTAIDDRAALIPSYRHGRFPELEAQALVKCEDVPEPPQDTFNILLRHRPILRADGCPGWQLMLSGHTHGGQIFPFSLTIPLTCPYRTSRWHQLDHGLRLYVCQGTGFWGPPFRFLIPPEIVIIELRHAPEAGATSTP